jgi:alpha-1,2-mannosyltransferase
VLRASGLRPGRAWLLGAVPLALAFEPVRTNLGAGQVNVLLMALVAADCLAPRGRRHRGLLLGLAAAVKLTPAAFVLFLVLDRDRKAALRGGASFAAATALGFLFAGRGSVTYWTGTVWDTGRIGGDDYASNQSIMGVLSRFDVPQPLRGHLWLGLAALVLVLATAGTRRALAAGRTGIALGVNATAELLVSPVSWAHHWVWAVPIVLALALTAVRERARWARVPAVAGSVVFVLSPQWWFPSQGDRERLWPLWQQLVGDSYVWFGLAFLAVAALVRHDRTPRPEPVAAPVPALSAP